MLVLFLLLLFLLLIDGDIYEKIQAHMQEEEMYVVSMKDQRFQPRSVFGQSHI
jgi:hypothetical protein